jgi:hypothetical protein
MRILFTTLILSIIFLGAQSQTGNVGIGTAHPSAMLHVSDSAVLFTGPVNLPATTPFYPPVSGAGSRMMWYPQKAAFRVGIVDNTNWDKDSIGRFSFATGYNTRSVGEGAFAAGVSSVAKGSYSTSMGYSTQALGSYSTSMGDETIASGDYSTSMGNYATASGDYSTSIGYATTANGIASTSMGNLTIANGDNSTSIGAYTHANGSESTSMGYGSYANGIASTSMGYGTIASGNYSSSMSFSTTASGDYSTSMGLSTRASGVASSSMGLSTISRSNYSLVVGKFNDTSNTNRLFEIGNGSASNARSNAMTVLTNGNIGIGTTNPLVPLSFENSLGNKVALYTTSATQQYGMGVISGVFQIYGDAPVADIAFGYGSSGSFTERMRIKGTGNVGIGTSTPSQALQVIGNIIASGTITPSDARYKKNITPIVQPLEKLQQLNGVTYNYRNDEFPDMKFTDVTQVGLIAQDVEKVFPQLVFADDKGYKAVDYVKLIPLLIEGMKEQQKVLQQQQQLLVQQQLQIDALIATAKNKK